MDNIDKYTSVISLETKAWDLKTDAMNTQVGVALGKAKGVSRAALSFGGYLAVLSQAGILALPLGMAYKGARSAKRINKLKGAPEMLNEKLVYAMTDLS